MFSLQPPRHISNSTESDRPPVSGPHVATSPLAAVSNRNKAALLNYFVGKREHIRRDSQVKCFGGLEIDKQLELGQPHDR